MALLTFFSFVIAISITRRRPYQVGQLSDHIAESAVKVVTEAHTV